MHVGLNKPLKDYVCYKVEAFMMKNPPGTKLNRKFVTGWISKAWAKFKEQPNIVLNTWKKIGYTGLVMTPTADNGDSSVDDPLHMVMGEDTARDESDSELSGGSQGY